MNATAAPTPVEWRPAPGLEGRYEISENGALRNVARGTYRKPYKSRFGYHVMRVGVDGRLKNFSVHRLVATAFLGAQPSPGMVVNHKDFCKTNNHFSNLEWCSGAENTRHYNDAVASGELSRIQKKGSEIYNARLNEGDVAAIKRMLNAETRPTYRAIARQFGVAMTTISSIRYGHSWKHVSCEARA